MQTMSTHREPGSPDHTGLDPMSLLRLALAGEDLVLDRESCTLHDLTQLAAALHEDAKLEVRNADLMTPIERASVASAARGRVLFR